MKIIYVRKIVKRSLILLCAVGAFGFILACSSDPFGNRHVLVIGIDGVRPDALQAAATPNIDGLITNGSVSYQAFAGGELGTPSQQPTVSGPGWSSILTGVWVDKHHVKGNKFEEPNYDNYPHFFKRIKEANPHAYLSSIVTWEPIHYRILSDEDYRYTTVGEDYGMMDADATKNAVEHLGSADPDALFFYLGDVDETGHKFGYSTEVPEYMKALEIADAQVGAILEAITSRPNYKNEDWLVIVTTDHGGLDTGHGGQSEDERTIFFITSGNGANRGELSPGPGHVAVPPTVFKHLGISVKPEWGWEGEVFGLRKDTFLGPPSRGD
jgi:predicted AlkP superfamily pyrophosphatase or phosphodiesterase